MKMLPTFETDKNGLAQPQGALVAIDPHTGQIKAMVGGRGTDQFNRATMAERQPGSAFKPFVFVAALENRFTPNTIIEDSPVMVGDWEPLNYNRNYNGKVTLRYVAEQSLNVPTVKIAQKIGMDKPIYYAQEMGISTFVLDGPTNDRGLATSLGGLTRGVTPLELTSAYGTFANQGIHVDPTAILKVLDRNGKVLEQAKPKQKNVISEASANDLTSMLQGVITRGTGTGAALDRPAAGKTGTTSDYCDAWFVGYTTDLVAGVWIGCDDNSDLDGMTGGNLPASVWQAFMEKATANMPVRYFESGPGYRSDSVDELKDDGHTTRAGQKKDQKQDNQRNTAPQHRQQTPSGSKTEEQPKRGETPQQPSTPTRPAAGGKAENPEPEPEPAPTQPPASPTVGGPSTAPSMTGGMGKGR